SHGRIPRTVFALQQPAPFRGPWKQDPNGDGQRAGQVGDGTVDTDDEVEPRHGGGDIVERLRVELAAQVRKRERDLLNLLRAGAYLQAIKLHARQVGELLKPGQPNGALGVERMRRIALPTDADAQTRKLIQFVAPALDDVRMGRQIRDLG